MQYLRVAATAGLTTGLLTFDGLMILYGAGDAGLGGSGLMGAGLGAILTLLLALGIADGAARQWGSEDGASRTQLLTLSLLGIAWTLLRIELGDLWAVPAVVGLTWIATQTSLFSEAVLDDDTEETEEGVVKVAAESAATAE